MRFFPTFNWLVLHPTIIFGIENQPAVMMMMTTEVVVVARETLDER
jgi:type IV secretory pathway VirB3-like protein